MSRRREFFFVTLAFLAILAALFWRVVLRQEALVPGDILFYHDPLWRSLAPPGFSFPANPLLSDQIFMYYPWRVFSNASLLQGIVPLWNPFVLGGTPFLANMQSAIFYPLNLLLLVLPMPVGIGYLAIARLLIAALSTYYYLRIIGIGRSGSFVGGCAFAMSGFSIVWLGSPLSNVAILLPLALLITESMLIHPRRTGLRLAALALVIGAQFLGGHPETSLHFGLVWAAYVALRLIMGWRRGERWQTKGRPGLFVCVSCLVGVAIGAVQILPFLSVLGESTAFLSRQGAPGSNWFFYPRFWQEALGFATILFPNALGNPSLSAGASLNPFSNFSEQAAYVGTIPLLLAIIGATMWRRNRFVAFWLGTAIVATGVAFRVPIFEAVNHLPLTGMAINGRLRLALTLALAILSGFGTDILVSKAHDVLFLRKLRRWLAISASVGLAGVLAVFAVLSLFREPLLGYVTRFAATNIAGSSGFVEPVETYLNKLPAMYDSLTQFYNPLSLRVAIPVYVAAIFWLALWLFNRKRPGTKWLKGPILLLTIAELSILAYPYNPTVDARQVYPETGAIRFLRENAGAARIAGVSFALNPNGSMVWQLRDIRGYEMTVDQRFQTFYSSFATGLPFGAYNLLANADDRLLDLLGVKYVVAQSGSVKTSADLPVVYVGEGVDISENKNRLPRAFLVGKSRLIADPGQILETMQSPAFKPDEEVLLETGAPSHVPTTISGRAEVTDVNANEVEVQVLADAPSWLVLSDTFDPGWKAYVDGQRVEIYRANYVMRAVRVGAAEHRVRFVYDPPAYSLGLRITLAALLLLGAIIIFPMLWRTAERSVRVRTFLSRLESEISHNR
ncbi:MAG: YfhO family protein [Dehalococcoidia bacterium]|nr:YfhO family protein [Dehalococcoidia bacterium]